MKSYLTKGADLKFGKGSLVYLPLCWEICAVGGRSGSEASQEILNATAESCNSANATALVVRLRHKASWSLALPALMY